MASFLGPILALNCCLFHILYYLAPGYLGCKCSWSLVGYQSTLLWPRISPWFTQQYCRSQKLQKSGFTNQKWAAFTMASMMLWNAECLGVKVLHQEFIAFDYTVATRLYFMNWLQSIVAVRLKVGCLLLRSRYSVYELWPRLPMQFSLRA